MPIGEFLDVFPPVLFIAAHVAFLAVGVWAAKRATDSKAAYAPVFWLYVASQVGFLAFFLGGILTLKTAVLLEQTLVVIMVIWIAATTQAVSRLPEPSDQTRTAVG